MIQALSAGASFVMSEKFDPEGIIEDCEEYQITQVALIPPTIIYRIAAAKNMDRDKLRSVRLCIMAGGPTDPETADKVFDTFPNTVLYLNYGSSENAITLGHVMSREDCRKHPWMLKSSGINNMASAIRLLDDDGNEVENGKAGEAWGKSPCQLKAYIGEELRSKDGWIPTGDIFRKDEDGYYYFVCRKKNMIKSAGENVYSEEVENIIKKHPAVQDCIVFGYPHKEYGELVAAAVVLKSGVTISGSDLISYCRTQMASYKKPRKIYFLKELPTAATGKIQRKVLKEELLKRVPDYSL